MSYHYQQNIKKHGCLYKKNLSVTLVNMQRPINER